MTFRRARKEDMGSRSDVEFRRWNGRQAIAESMIPLIGTLYRDHGVVTSIYGRRLINQSAVEILKAHRFARQVDEFELPIEETLPVLVALVQLKLGAASVDLAKLLARYKEAGTGRDLTDFLREELAPVVGAAGDGSTGCADVVLYGFGRIGRLLARILIAHAGDDQGLRLRRGVKRCR